jgi:hypothetical protein
MHDAAHITALLSLNDPNEAYEKARQKAFGYEGDKYNLKEQETLFEYIEVLRICRKHKTDIVAIRMGLKDYIKEKERLDKYYGKTI